MSQGFEPAQLNQSDLQDKKYKLFGVLINKHCKRLEQVLVVLIQDFAEHISYHF